MPAVLSCVKMGEGLAQSQFLLLSFFSYNVRSIYENTSYNFRIPGCSANMYEIFLILNYLMRI